MRYEELSARMKEPEKRSSMTDKLGVLALHEFEQDRYELLCSMLTKYEAKAAKLVSLLSIESLAQSSQVKLVEMLICFNISVRIFTIFKSP